MGNISQKLSLLLESSEACGPVSLREIEAAQSELGLLFPPSYRLFLERFGAVLGDGFEIAGLTPDLGEEQPTWSDMLSSTLMYRRQDALPEDSVYISDNGAGLSYFLKCSRSDPTFEGAVIEWGPDHGGGAIYAETFVSFVEHRRDR